MPFPVPYTYFTMRGSFGLTAGSEIETWQVGFKIPALGGNPSAAQLADFLADMETPARTFHAITEVGAGNITHLKALTAAVIGTDGKYTGGGSQVTTERLLSPALGGAGVAVMPYQIASVYSLRTNILRGPASHGRFYYPCLSRTWDGGSDLWNATQVQSAATAAVTLIKAINDQADGNLGLNGGVCVMSSVGSGRLAAVEKVLVGRRPDTQRRRVRNVAEDYREASTPVALEAVEARRHLPLN